jgi:TM2 domain-containing membrane protein YozV
LLTAYALWFFMGLVGAHRIYCGRIMSGLAQLALAFVLLIAALALGRVYIFAIPIVLWWLFDASQISAWVRTMNVEAATAPSSS